MSKEHPQQPAGCSALPWLWPFRVSGAYCTVCGVCVLARNNGSASPRCPAGRWPTGSPTCGCHLKPRLDLIWDLGSGIPIPKSKSDPPHEREEATTAPLKPDGSAPLSPCLYYHPHVPRTCVTQQGREPPAGGEQLVPSPGRSLGSRRAGQPLPRPPPGRVACGRQGRNARRGGCSSASCPG